MLLTVTGWFLSTRPTQQCSAVQISPLVTKGLLAGCNKCVVLVKSRVNWKSILILTGGEFISCSQLVSSRVLRCWCLWHCSAQRNCCVFFWSVLLIRLYGDYWSNYVHPRRAHNIFVRPAGAPLVSDVCELCAHQKKTDFPLAFQMVQFPKLLKRLVWSLHRLESTEVMHQCNSINNLIWFF